MKYKILKIHDVIECTGLSRSAILNLVKKQQFPSPMKVGLRVKGWLASEIEAWIEKKMAEREES